MRFMRWGGFHLGACAELLELLGIARRIQRQLDRFVPQRRPHHGIGQLHGTGPFGGRGDQGLAIQNRIDEILQDRPMLAAVIRELEYLFRLGGPGVMLRGLPAEITDRSSRLRKD